MHIGRATTKAIKLARESNCDMAVVSCGCGQYTVKTHSLAMAHYPWDIRRVVKSCGEVIDV